MNQLSLLGPTVVNRRTHDETVYIGRGGAFGNPYVIGKDGDRDKVIRMFETFARSNPPLLAKIKAIPAFAILGCYCKPLECHGDVIVKLWKEMNT